jgi:3',5'-cyclic-AMP phosphodiesterase
MIVFAQFSDTHLDGSQRRADRAAAVMAYLNGLSTPLAAVLVTGDIADHGLPAEYEQARRLLSSSPYPVFCCPGNHDVRAAYRKVLLSGEGGGDHGEPMTSHGQDHGATLSSHGRAHDGVQTAGGKGDIATGKGDAGVDGEVGAPINGVHRAAGALFALCDSTIPGRDDGYLADETIAWLDSVLTEQPDMPAFVCFHHPPVQLHSPYIDSIRQFGEQRLAEALSRHPQVVGILCGHAHTPAASTFAGRPVLVAPGVVSTLVLPWEHGDIVDEHAPPGVAFHVLDDKRRLTTHYRAVIV